jgi:hypothetical protein
MGETSTLTCVGVVGAGRVPHSGRASATQDLRCLEPRVTDCLAWMPEFDHSVAGVLAVSLEWSLSSAQAGQVSREAA